MIAIFAASPTAFWPLRMARSICLCGASSGTESISSLTLSWYTLSPLCEPAALSSRTLVPDVWTKIVLLPFLARWATPSMMASTEGL